MSCRRILRFLTIVVAAPLAAAPLAAQHLEVVPALAPAIDSLTRGSSAHRVLRVRVVSDTSLSIDTAWARFTGTPEMPPDGTRPPTVVGLTHVMIGKSQETDVGLLYPPYPKPATWSADLYFRKKGSPDGEEKFAAITLAIAEPSGALAAEKRRLAGWIAFVFPFIILVLTYIVKGTNNRNFFQSPDQSYSVSRFQVWLWTCVVGFSYAFLFFTRGPNISFPDSVWGLIGISLASISAATAVAIKNEPGPPAQAAAGAAAAGAAVAGAAAVGAGVGAGPAGVGAAIKSMLSDDGAPSIMRLQMFTWTIATAAFFVWQVYRTGVLWDVPPSLLVLMGVSHASYLIDKVVTK